MTMRLRLLTALAVSTATAAAQTIIPVTSLDNTGTGTLRSAITTANASTSPIIDVRVAGTIVLQTALPLLSASRPITIRQTGATGRLVVDARIPTASAAGTALFVQGAGTQLLLPLTILVTNGVGLRVSAANVRIDDTEIVGGSQQGFWGYAARDLRVTRLRVRQATIGLRLEDCDGSQLGIGGGVVESVDNSGDGILITGSNADVAIQSFVCERNAIGVQVLLPARIALGSNAAPRSRAAANRSYGVNLQTLVNTGVVALQNADIVDNGAYGVRVDNGSDVVIEDCRIAGSASAGIEFGTGTARPRLRRCTIERNFGNGVEVWSIGTAVIEGCTLRENVGYGAGLYSAPGVTFGPGNRVDDNHHNGVFALACPDLQFIGNPSIARNRGVGMDVRQSPRARIADSTFAENDGISLWLRDGSHDVVVGPRVTVRDARGTGINIESVGNTLVHGSTVLGASVYGIQCITDGRALSGNRIVGCLIADSAGIGLILRNGPPLRCELSTIARNLRGVYATQTYANQPSRIDLDSCLVWGNTLEDLSTTSPDGVVVPVNSFFQVPAPAGNGNRSSNPMFVDFPGGDFRLQRGSPAVDAGNAAIALPSGTTDAWGQPRVSGPRVDCGAHEVQFPQPRLEFFPDFMPAYGGNVAFTARYPTADQGALAVLLLELDGPTGTSSILGATIPLADTPALFLLASDAFSSNTMTLVPAGGVVQGSLAFAGRMPAVIRDVVLNVVGVTISGTPTVRTVTNVARIRVR